MPVKLNSSQVQQNFGQALDRALMEDDVIVELLRTRLQQASAAASARAAYLAEEEVDELIERARSEVYPEESAT